MDYPGKVITKTQVTPTQTSASGNWTLDDQAAAIKNNNWPVALVPNPISKSLRFNSADSAYLNRTPASAGNRQIFTWSGWVKRSASGNVALFTARTDDSNRSSILFESENLRCFNFSGGSVTSNLVTSAVFRDFSAWYHVVISMNTTTQVGKIYVNGVEQTLGTNTVALNSNFFFNNTNAHAIGRTEYSTPEGYFNGYLTEINFIDGQALTPSSFGMTNPQTGQWIPLKYSGTYGTNGFYLNFKDATSTTTLGYDYSGNANNWTTNNFSVGGTSSKVLEIVDATKSGSVTLSATVVGSGTVNLTAFGGCGNISGSVFTGIGSLNGLISDWQTHTVYKNGSSLFTVQGGAVNNNSGTQTATQSRTAQTVTQTISVVNGDVISIAFGANNAVTAYYGYPGGAPSLTIAASSGAFIADGSANDSLTDVPTPWFAYNTTGDVGGVIRGNYATLNPVWKNLYPGVYANGNLDFSTSTAKYGNAFSTIGLTSGKWYVEVLVSGTVGSAVKLGVSNQTTLNYLVGTEDDITPTTGVGYGYYLTNGNKATNGTTSAYGTSVASGDIVGIILDLDNGKIWFSKNGTVQASGDPVAGTNAAFTGITASSVWFFGGTTYATQASFVFNFGQRPFAYTPPTGFRSLCTTNLPATAIGFGLTNQGDDYFNTTLYTGTGSDLAIVNSGGMAPDFVWVKVRNQAFSHNLNDIIRGTNNRLQSDTTAAEGTTGIVSFNSNGFTTRGASGELGANGNTYVAWQWKGGGTGVSNTAGTITSTVSANTTAGFSVVTYTGTGSSPQSIGHGLGATPSMIILKSRSSTSDWYVNHVSIGTNDLRLNSTGASAANNFFSAKSSTTFTINFNQTGNWVAYCFAAVPGYSAFGSYTGNSSNDGPFIYTGFRPRWVMIKQSSASGEGWFIVDTARDTYNAMGTILIADTSGADNTSQYPYIDYVSNGFKLRKLWAGVNGSGSTYIYAAFAETPFQFSNAR
jgi:hypothetical protein